MHTCILHITYGYEGLAGQQCMIWRGHFGAFCVHACRPFLNFCDVVYGIRAPWRRATTWRPTRFATRPTHQFVLVLCWWCNPRKLRIVNQYEWLCVSYNVHLLNSWDKLNGDRYSILHFLYSHSFIHHDSSCQRRRHYASNMESHSPCQKPSPTSTRSSQKGTFVGTRSFSSKGIVRSCGTTISNGGSVYCLVEHFDSNKYEWRWWFSRVHHGVVVVAVERRGSFKICFRPNWSSSVTAVSKVER